MKNNLKEIFKQKVFIVSLPTCKAVFSRAVSFNIFWDESEVYVSAMASDICGQNGQIHSSY